MTIVTRPAHFYLCGEDVQKLQVTFHTRTPIISHKKGEVSGLGYIAQCPFVMKTKGIGKVGDGVPTDVLDNRRPFCPPTAGCSRCRITWRGQRTSLRVTRAHSSRAPVFSLPQPMVAEPTWTPACVSRGTQVYGRMDRGEGAWKGKAQGDLRSRRKTGISA